MIVLDDYRADRVSLADVLGRQQRYEVPDYQRPYMWKDVEVEDLWADLMNHYMDDVNARSDGYLMGSIVTLSDPSSNKHNIVDGQQRLVTLTLLLCAMRDSIRKHTSQRSGSDRANLENLIKEIDVLIVDQNGKGLIELNDGNGTSVLSEIQESRHSYDGLKQQRKTTKRDSVKRLIDNYKNLMLETDKLCDRCNLDSTGVSLIEAIQVLRNIINDMKEKSFFVRIDIFNEDYSHQVFQSLNSKGRPLNEADLIKSYLMKLGKTNTQSFKWLGAKWDEIVKNRDDKVDLLLYESMLSRPRSDQSSKDPRKKYLYRFVRDKYKTDEDAKTYLKEIEKDAEIIALLDDPSSLPDKFPVELKHSFFGIKQIGARYIRRPIIAACREWGETERSTSLLVDCLLKFFFMYRTIGESNIDTLKKISKKTTQQIVSGDELGMIIPTILNSDKASGASNVDEGVFKKKFKEEILELNHDVAKYILISLEHQLASPGGISPTIAGSNLELEHIFPEQPNNEWLDSEKLEPHRCRLGNLTMMPASWNKHLSNRSFKDKKSGWEKNSVCYEKSSLKLNQQYLKDYENWTSKEIKDREEKLCELAFGVWTLEKYRGMVR